jgi:predicted DNA-binding ribbon-helix-helix protein
MIKKRSVDIAGHRTSVSIEAPFWDALREIAARQKVSVNELIAIIDNAREGNLSSAIRVYVLKDLQAARGN